MAVLYNLARMTTATTGTGTITLGSAVTGFLSFATAGVSNGQVISYAIEDGSSREIGTGTYTSAGTTLTRSVTKSTNADAAISLSGSAQVFITPRKEDIVTPDHFVWSSWSPTITATSGTFTSVTGTGIYCQIGKLVHVGLKVVCTTVGTAAGIMQSTLPVTADAASFQLTGSGYNASSANLAFATVVGSNAVSMLYDGGAFPITSGQTVHASFFYKAA